MATPDEIGLFSSPSPLYGTEALAVDRSNHIYLTHYRLDTSPPFGTHLYVTKVSGDTGTVSPIGYVGATVESIGLWARWSNPRARQLHR